MRKLIYILFLLPLFAVAQYTPDLLLASLQQNSGNPELYTVANALATGANEANATTGLTSQSGAVLASITSPTPQDGSYAIRVTETSNPDRMEETVNLTDATTYVIGYWAWEGTGAGRSQLWTGFVASPDQSYTSTPTYYEHTLTTSGTTQLMRFYSQSSSTVFYIDGLSIKEQ